MVCSNVIYFRLYLKQKQKIFTPPPPILLKITKWKEYVLPEIYPKVNRIWIASLVGKKKINSADFQQIFDLAGTHSTETYFPKQFLESYNHFFVIQQGKNLFNIIWDIAV